MARRAPRGGEAEYPDLKAWRTAKGLKQHEAAALLGMPLRQYTRYEHRICFPHRSKIARLAEQTGVSMMSLAGLA